MKVSALALHLHSLVPCLPASGPVPMALLRPVLYTDLADARGSRVRLPYHRSSLFSHLLPCYALP